MKKHILELLGLRFSNNHQPNNRRKFILGLIGARSQLEYEKIWAKRLDEESMTYEEYERRSKRN